ncbi:MAG: hypothetical protein HYV54_02700 [Parcubacteria group bacterium]|nr:hypothetical protein [Parcubacteria group bacterium]
MKYKIIVFVAGMIAVILLLTLWPKEKTGAGPLDDFAKCLADKNIIMYGADWCPHCQTQKKMFGKSFQYINYVECPQDPQKCLAAGIEGYPTWVTANGEKLIGEQKIETLSKKTNCPID